MQLFCCRRRDVLSATAAVVICATVAARAADDEAAIAPIQRLIDGLLQVMKAGLGTPFSQRFAMLAPIVDRTFDLAAILRELVGPTWSTLPPDQQGRC